MDVAEAVRKQLAAVQGRIRHDESRRAVGKPARGGLSVLLQGPAGTGKRAAAAALARAAGGDPVRIDLSKILSKYIGETEKNLAALFDRAERQGAVLLFDEADALFGKRGGVRDSNDRFANQEASFLLRRIESFDGLVIFLADRRANIDPAFLRRMRFAIDFAAT